MNEESRLFSWPGHQMTPMLVCRAPLSLSSLAHFPSSGVYAPNPVLKHIFHVFFRAFLLLHSKASRSLISTIITEELPAILTVGDSRFFFTGIKARVSTSSHWCLNETSFLKIHVHG